MLLDAGSERQQSDWLPRIGAGEAILTTAITEPGGGLASAEIRTRISPAGNGFRIDGTKLFVRDAGVAEAVICLARCGDGPDDLTLAMVPRESPGLSLQRLNAAGGEAVWEVRFAGVTIDADAIVGEFGNAWRHVERLLLRAAAFKSAELVGIGQASLDLTIDYAKTRIQFNKPIGSFQAVQHHCANMFRDLELSRLLAWQAAGSLGEGSAGAREVAMAKAKCSDAIPTLTRTAQQPTARSPTTASIRLSLLPPRDRCAGGLRRCSPSSACPCEASALRRQRFPGNRSAWPTSSFTSEQDEKGVVLVTINDPDAKNAVNWQMNQEMIREFERIDRDMAARVLILTGSGTIFCSGGNIKRMTAQGMSLEPPNPTLREASIRRRPTSAASSRSCGRCRSLLSPR